MAVPLVEASGEFVGGVASRDVQLGESIWVRIFLPQSKQVAHEKAKPVVLYAHGGAYCVGQPNWLHYHTFCSTMSIQSNSIWISLSYRLAPTHRLPAAYDDASLALRWLAEQARQQQSHTSHPWLSQELADFSNFFLAGESAGACIVLKVAMDAIVPDLRPVCIRGLMLIQPGFHSEKKRGFDKENDERYGMALPVGETLDYAPINPIHPAAPPLTPLSAYPHIFLNATELDFRYEATLRFYEIVQGVCPDVQLIITPGKGHAFHLEDPLAPEALDLHAQLVSFIHASTTT
eukprot:c38532_g1_i1 orf=32-904(+)